LAAVVDFITAGNNGGAIISSVLLECLWFLIFRKQTTTFGVRVSKNHHFSGKFQKTTNPSLTVAKNTDRAI
jgi:hypothetical protein